MSIWEIPEGDCQLDPPLNEVYVRDVTCADHIEKLYFSAGYQPICIYCAGAVDEMNTDFSLSAVNVHNQKFPGNRITLKTCSYMYILHFCILCFVSCVLVCVYILLCYTPFTMVSYYTCLCVVCVQEIV